MTHPDLTPLVHKIARRYAWCGANYEDLVAEGFLGVAIAADRFDPERGFKFITYAHHWIRGKVQRAADKHIKANTGTYSLDIQDENGRTVADKVAAPESSDSLTPLISKSLAHVLSSLPLREQIILGRRYGQDVADQVHGREAVRNQIAGELQMLKR
jgi:RNA polymerase sigma factor (sigma-70 family)